MSGAIAGTAILKNSRLSDELNTITLTINNNCNLSCPHCYLQYNKKNFLLAEPTIDSVFKSDFKHLAIVGKEPLLNRESIKLVHDLINRCKKMGKSISLITNGTGLEKLNPISIGEIDYIDVSFDGGPKTYEMNRKGTFDRIIDSINNIQEKSRTIFNALHTIHSANINNIDDMLEIRNYADFDIIMFSPYLKTHNDGTNEIESVKLEDILKKLSSSYSFNNTNSAYLLIDTYHLAQESITESVIEELISKYSLESKVKLFAKDALLYGIIRVTFDDLVLTPEESLHPIYYFDSFRYASNHDLNQIFSELKEKSYKNKYDYKRAELFL
ncbi:MAG: radical SAM protein [Melioribacteraceae bacterium]|nr:radical SAM protein [Melioribacteraceae bacterium]MCF8353916.1 radical SAM protein [Melioribacteraceae bacterium]MCF8392673.1 radical SAM protein [Melioribacteraceae bacterium]MCF8417694.1 radical SAM protein [Melioribacteraceae bacterium]